MPTPVTNIWLKNFGTNLDYPHSLTSGAGYLWVGNESNYGTVVRVDPNSPTDFNAVFFPQDGKHEWVSDTLYIASKNKVYCLMGKPNSSGGYVTVTEVDPVTLAFTDVIYSPAYNVEQGSFACDGTYLYIASRMIPNVYKYRISDWALVATLTTNVPLQHCCRIDDSNTKMYVTSSDITPGTLAIVEITLASFTVTQQTIFYTDRVLTDDMAISSDYLWVGSEQSGNIVRVSRTNLNSATVINMGMNARNFGVYYDGESIWTGWEGSPGIAARMNPTTLAIEYLQFADPVAQTSPNEFLRIGNRMYFTHYHLAGSMTAMGVAGTIPAPAPTNLLFSDRIQLSDFLNPSDTIQPGLEFGDAISLVDRLNTSRFQGTPNSDTVVLSDAAFVSLFTSFSFSDTLNLADGLNEKGYQVGDTLNLSDTVSFLLGGPTILSITRAVGDRFELFDSLSFTLPKSRVLITESLFLRDNADLVVNSTIDDYLRRYLNDMLR